MKLVPMADKIVVKRDEAEKETPGGILLPDVAKNRPQRGRVLAVGPGKTMSDGKLVPLALTDGDSVVFTAYAGNEVDVDGETYLLMREEDVLARLESGEQEKKARRAS